MTARSLLAAAGLLALLVSAGCAYRIQGPVALDETVRVQVVADQGRYPRAGAYLQTSVADALATYTGWQVRPGGSAHLDLSLDDDRVSANADDVRGVPSRWSITLRGTALLTTARGIRTFRFTGTSYAGTREQEPAALRAACDNAAVTIAQWLQQVDLSPAGPGKH